MSKPTLYLMVGYPGAGKTTAARLIAEVTGAEHLWADHERRQRHGEPTYSHAENLALYKELNDVAATKLAQGKSVVYDTNFNFFKDREKLRQIAQQAGAETKLVWVTTDKQTAKGRATTNAHKQETRVLGNMPVEHFERMSRNLEEPASSEQPIKIEGRDLTAATVRAYLGL